MATSSSSSSASDHAAPVSDQSSNQQQVKQTEKGRISFMDTKLFNAAAQGNIQVFNDYSDPLDLLLTPNRRTILHIHISSQTEPLGPTYDFRILGAPIFFRSFKISPPPATSSAAFVMDILRRSPSLLNKANIGGETPLHIAARYGRDDIVQLLIDFAKGMRSQDPESHGVVGEMLRMTTVDKDTALHEAVRRNHEAVVRLLTIEDPELRYSGNHADETPLYLAAERGYHDIVFAILETCDSPDCNGPNGRTALHAAVISNDKAMTEMMLEKLGTHLAKRVDQQGWTPLHHAAYFGRLSIVKLLLSKDKSAAYISSRDGMTPLHIAASRRKLSCVQVIKTIISHCPDCCEIADQKGWNFLHFAAARSNERVLREILQYSIMSDLLNKKDIDGNTPLHLLVAQPITISGLVLHPLLDLNAVNSQSKTAMDMILTSSHDQKHDSQKKTLFRRLWKKGGRPSWRNEIPVPPETKLQHEFVSPVLPELTAAQESHLIVAILIATVTFAAAFTMPGGYNHTDSSTTSTLAPAAAPPGRAILSRNPLFIAFLVSDSLALLLSISAVLIYFFLAVKGDQMKFIILLAVAFYLNSLALFLMVGAFLFATIAVVPHFLGIYIITTFVCSMAIWFIIFFLSLFDLETTNWEKFLWKCSVIISVLIFTSSPSHAACNKLLLLLFSTMPNAFLLLFCINAEWCNTL